ncbi:MAG: cellulase family glycosylhydrolase [Bacteroidales bacterium]|nr:cellulase family glycosylhydrolase [Bacteroidales bacterium]
MRKYIAIVVMGIISMSAFIGCQPDDLKNDVVEFKIGATEFVFTAAGGTQELFVQTTAEVGVTGTASWCTVVKEPYASDKISKFTISVQENPNVSEREKVLSVMIDGEEAGRVTVTQRGYSLLVDEAPVRLPYTATTFYITAQAAEDYEVSFGDASWLTLEEKDIKAGTALFAATLNMQNFAREAVITFTSADEQYQVQVIQAANDEDVPEADMTGMESDAKTLMKKMELGINLGNTLEATGGETSWGAPRTTEAMIKYIKGLGFNAVRIPCSWHQYLEPGDGYVVKSSWMSRVKEVVDYVVDNDMYAILNIHWDQGWLENDIPNGYDEAVNAEQHSIWTQIATTFRDYDEHLVFAGTNEPNAENASHMETLLRYEQTFVDAVRKTGGRNAYRVLVVQGPSTDIDKTDQLMDRLPVDSVEDRLAAEVHYYTPWTFCGLAQDESWGKMMYFWGDEQESYAAGAYAGRWDRNYNEGYVAKQMAKMKKKFWDKGIPVIIGEYSVCTTKNCNLGTAAENEKAYEGYMKSRAAFNACVVRESKANGCVPFYWHCEGDLIDRSELKVTEQATYEAIIEAGKTQYPD